MVPQAVASAVAEVLTLLAGFGKGKEKKGFFDWYFNSRKPKDPQPMARTTPMRIEPKTFFANERTFLSWLHMAVTIGSIAAALLGFAGVTESHKKPDIRVSPAAYLNLYLCRVREHAGSGYGCQHHHCCSIRAHRLPCYAQ